ncbi:helix-turn-helix transcriptional regulator [Microbacterium rhizophilus]|uniref:helix-turn-helix transcriptional regulator n=1 Tax=Microbacterium rhizophilus TaxID=3138934 RepID=UPI0031ECAB12
MSESLFADLRDDAVEYLRSGVSVSLSGLPGSGRSALLRAVVEQIAGAGWETVEIHGSPALRSRPLEALAVAGLLDSRAPGAGTPVSTAVAALHRAIAGERTVLVIDDADLMDETSAGAIVAALHDRPVPLLSSTVIARIVPEFSLAAFVRPGVRLVMPPLAFGDATELIEQLCGGPVAVETAARIHAKSGGLPGLMEAIIDNGLREGLIAERGGMWRGAPTMWSPRLAGVVEPFLQGLAPSQLDALLKLSLVGAVDVSVARQLVAWGDVEALDERGLLAFASADGAVTLSVYPPLLSEHLSRDRMGARRMRVLDEIDATLADRRAPDRPRPPIAPGALDAAGQGGYLPRRGLGRPATEDAENRSSLDATLNRMVYERLTAESLVRKAEWQRRQDAPAAIAYAVSLMALGGDRGEIDSVLATPSARCDEKDRALLSVWRALVLASAPGGMDRARAFLAAEREHAGEWAGLLDANLAHLAYVYEATDPDEPLPEPPDGAPPMVAGTIRTVRAEQLLALGRPAAALDELDLIDDEDPSLLQGAAPLRTLALVLAGDLLAAEEEARGRFDEGISRLDPDAITAYGYALALILVLRGDDASLRDHVGILLSVGYTPLRHSHFHLGALVAAGRVAAGIGRKATARSIADQADRVVPTIGPLPLMTSIQARAHARLAAGDAPPAVAGDLWAAAEEAVGRGYAVNALMLAVRCLELDPDRSRVDRMSEWGAGAEPGGLAGVLVEYGRALAGSAVAEMLPVADELARLGYAGWSIRVQIAAAALASRTGEADDAEIARRVREQAERLGGAYPALVRPLLQEHALTAREREIAQLAAQGMSNGEIARKLVVSTRTVENHLYRVFQKLRVEGRHQLAAALEGTAS